MKLKSLILGSVAAAGMSTASFAADPLGVLTSLNVCDALGLSGLTISSDTNCLQISGGVSYEFSWGDYDGSWDVVNVRYGTEQGWVQRDAPNFFQGEPAVTVWTYDYEFHTNAPSTHSGTFTSPVQLTRAQIQAQIALEEGLAPAIVNGIYDDGDGEYTVTPPSAGVAANPDAFLDWESKVEAWLRFVGTADSDFGPAAAVIKLKAIEETVFENGEDDDGDSQPFEIDQAYVQVGDTTVIMAGKKGTIANFGDDTPFNFTGLFRSGKVDEGTFGIRNTPRTGGHVIQVVSDLGNGVNIGVGLERLEHTDDVGGQGTLVGVVNYAGSGFSGHITAAAGGILDGEVDSWAVHAAGTATFDAFRLRGAFAASHLVGANETGWHGLVSGQATFDLFRIALSAEADGYTGEETNFGWGASVGAAVTDGVEINVGGRFYQNNETDTYGYHVAAQVVAAVTETVKLTGEVGVYGNDDPTSDWYGSAELAWAPGGGFTSSLGATVQENGAYKVTFKAAKTFQ